MRAIVYDEYGSPDVLEPRDIEKPTLTDDGVLVRVEAAAVNPLDWHMLTGIPYIARLEAGLRRPKSKVLGVDFAGKVEAVGQDVKELQPGDEVFGARTGAFAEYVCVREAVVRKPADLTAIDRRYELSEVPDAFRYLGQGHARAKVVVTH
jgi:NADPH:quinone reductase-like Zn-dependent oxidoreductase